jgi:hypothetical protein
MYLTNYLVTLILCATKVSFTKERCVSKCSVNFSKTAWTHGKWSLRGNSFLCGGGGGGRRGAEGAWGGIGRGGNEFQLEQFLENGTCDVSLSQKFTEYTARPGTG